MLLRFYILLSLILGTVIGLPLGIFESYTWLWALPLMALGFTQPEAKHALNGLDLEALTVEEAITQALKGFSL